MSKENTEALKKKMTAKPKAEIKYDPSECLSSGSTTLNLACSGNTRWAFARGNYYLYVGSSGSGKTFLTMTALAEAAINPKFDKHALIYVDAENGMLMDVERFFGPKLAARLEPIAGTRIKPIHPTILEDFYDHLFDRLKAGPCVILTDSMDALKPRAWMKKLETDRKKTAKGEEASGSYGTEKARINSDRMRMLPDLLRKHGSIFILISQSRDNIGFGAQFTPEIRGGGRALTFYAGLEMWTKVVGHLRKKVGDKEREQGILCQVRVKKNRITGRDRTAVIPILHSFGIDDLGSCVDYLVEEGKWKPVKKKEGEEEAKTDDKKKKVGKIDAKEFGVTGTREQIIRHIEAEGLEKDLRMLVAETFEEIEAACAVQRKSKYS